MPVKRRTAKMRRGDLSPIAWALLHDEPLPQPLGRGDDVEAFCLEDPDGADWPGCIGLRRLWLENSEEILAAWIEHAPGTRPSCWWRWSSPRWDRQPELREPRQAIGARLEDWHVSQRDFHLGIGRCWQGTVTAVQVESQASYLERHGLLSAAERRRLKPSDFEPEMVTP